MSLLLPGKYAGSAKVLGSSHWRCGVPFTNRCRSASGPLSLGSLTRSSIQESYCGGLQGSHRLHVYFLGHHGGFGWIAGSVCVICWWSGGLICKGNKLFTIKRCGDQLTALPDLAACSGQQCRFLLRDSRGHRSNQNRSRGNKINHHILSRLSSFHLLTLFLKNKVLKFLLSPTLSVKNVLKLLFALKFILLP